MASGTVVNEVKVKEGDKLVAEAEKSLKTNWLKWKPDYDNASHSFDKAAVCYRTAKAYEKAIEAFERASDAHYTNDAIFHSGKSLEQASNVCRDMKHFEQASSFLQRASTLYHESGHGDTAGQVLTKAAKLMESVDPVKSAEYYLATADLHDIEEKHREIASAVRAAVNMYAKARCFDKLLGALQRWKKANDELGHHTHSYEIIAIRIIVNIHSGDTVAAKQSLENACSMPGFTESDFGVVLEKLVESYREGDGEEFIKSCDHNVFRTMDNEIAKLARDLKPKLVPTDLNAQLNGETGPDEDDDEVADIL